MTKILQSSWMTALIGAIVYLGTTIALWKTPTPPPHAKAIEALMSKAPKPSWEFDNPEVAQLIDDLTAQKSAMQTREKQLDELAARLKAERDEVNGVMASVTKQQAEFDKNVVRVREEELLNLKKLAKIYAAMTPEGAVAILKELNDEDIVKIFALMKDSETAALLELLGGRGQPEAKRAALITEKLRLTISRAPTEGKS